MGGLFGSAQSRLALLGRRRRVRSGGAGLSSGAVKGRHRKGSEAFKAVEVLVQAAVSFHVKCLKDNSMDSLPPLIPKNFTHENVPINMPPFPQFSTSLKP